VNGESIRTASPRWALLQVGVWTGVGVNGRFIHRAANVVDLLISGEEEPIGTTDNHPFWSEDRQEYVPAGELRVGENLRTVNGSQTYVQSIRPRGPPEDVYNLEVEGAHTYHVGTTGVLVHNSCVYRGGSYSDIKKLRKTSSNPQRVPLVADRQPVFQDPQFSPKTIGDQIRGSSPPPPNQSKSVIHHAAGWHCRVVPIYIFSSVTDSASAPFGHRTICRGRLPTA